MLNEKELLFVVDENNNPAVPKPRNEVHRRSLWHRNAHIWIKNSKRQILCQQRSMEKDTNPGLWEPFFGGHVLAGEKYLVTAAKECNEELGLTITGEDLRFFRIFRIPAAKEFVAVYGLRADLDIGAITFEEAEIARLRWMDEDDLRDFVCVEDKPDWTRLGNEEDVLRWLAEL